MSKHNDHLRELAKKALDALHADQSVSVQQTLDALCDVREHLNVLIDAVKCSVPKGEDE